MEQLINIDTLIKLAQERGIDFGKGDPYNRLRYYTKIGWLPHMERKDGKGHYPPSALERLILIENLKAEGLTNEEISQRISSHEKANAFREILKSPEARTKVVTYASFAVLLLILSSELGIIDLGKPKDIIRATTQQEIPQQIIDSGLSFIPSNKNRVFVSSKNTTETRKVFVTFNDNIIPATRFWVSEKVPFEGFYVELDAPIPNNVEFSWWISN